MSWVLLVLAPALWAQDAASVPGLTLDAALQAAERHSRALVAQGSVATAAREMEIAAQQLPDPVLSLSLTNVPAEGTERWSLNRDFMTMTSIGMTQTLTREDKRLARGRRYAQEARLAQVQSLMALAELRRETAQSWLDCHYREEILVLLRRQRAETLLLVEATEAAYRAGESPQADVFLARAELGLADQNIRATEALLAAAGTMLSRWTGLQPIPSLTIPPRLDYTRLQDADLERELLQHPEHLLVAEEEALALADVDLAQQNKREDWSVEVMLSRRGPEFGNMVSVGVSRPLQLGQANKQDRELAAKLALVDSVRGQHIELLREHVAMVSSWLALWQGNLERLSFYDETLIPLAEQGSQATLAGYRGGAMSLSAVLDTRRAELDVRLARTQLELETASLWAQLEYLIPPETQAFDEHSMGGAQ